MNEREALLRGIFANPADPMPKLVFADYLNDAGEDDWADVLRMSCELAGLPSSDTKARAARRATIEARIAEAGLSHAGPDTGFAPCRVIEAPADLLMDFDRFRHVSVTEHPEWFGAKELKVVRGPLTTREPLVTLLTAPATQNVMVLDLSGSVAEVPAEERLDGGDLVTFFDMQRHPLITTKMVEELARMRECRRIVRLDLRNNGLGNDAARAIAATPHFQRLKHLHFLEGNDIKGRVWGQLRERYGEEVVY